MSRAFLNTLSRINRASIPIAGWIIFLLCVALSMQITRGLRNKLTPRSTDAFNITTTMQAPNITPGPYTQEHLPLLKDGQHQVIIRGQNDATVTIVRNTDRSRCFSDARALAHSYQLQQAAHGLVIEALICDHGDPYIEIPRETLLSLIDALKQVGYKPGK